MKPFVHPQPAASRRLQRQRDGRAVLSPCPAAPRDLSPSRALNPQCHTQRGKFPILLKTSPFRGEGVGKTSCNPGNSGTSSAEPSSLEAPPLPPPPAACAQGWGDATASGDPQPHCPQPHSSQHGCRAHPRGMQRWRRTRSNKAWSILQLPAASLARGTPLGSLLRGLSRDDEALPAALGLSRSTQASSLF